MLRVVIYGPDPTENHRVRELMEDRLWGAQIKPVFKEFTGEREPFFTYVKNNPYLVMLIVQSGPEGAETARLAKAGNPKTRIIWFSEQDCALLAFELGSTYFGLLPLSRETVRKTTSRSPRIHSSQRNRSAFFPLSASPAAKKQAK